MHNVSIPYKVNKIYHYSNGIAEYEDYQSNFTGLIETPIQFSNLEIQGIAFMI